MCMNNIIYIIITLFTTILIKRFSTLKPKPLVLETTHSARHLGSCCPCVPAPPPPTSHQSTRSIAHPHPAQRIGDRSKLKGRAPDWRSATKVAVGRGTPDTRGSLWRGGEGGTLAWGTGAVVRRAGAGRGEGAGQPAATTIMYIHMYNII